MEERAVMVKVAVQMEVAEVEFKFCGRMPRFLGITLLPANHD